MRRDYNKLVRDRIPEIIQNSGKHCAIETMSDAEYRQALLEKLVEEAQEARGAILHSAAPDELITELADLQEVFAAVLAAWEISSDLVQQVQTQRHAERGSFEQRLKLLWTEDGDG
jgi:predicted house-cleaning noncanonical NTP pyrophosphatase (MazG superfamily)